MSEVRITYADETLPDAIARPLRHGIGRLPVVSRQDPRQIVGYVGRVSTILAARHRYHHEEGVRERPFELNRNPVAKLATARCSVGGGEEAAAGAIID